MNGFLGTENILHLKLVVTYLFYSLYGTFMLYALVCVPNITIFQILKLETLWKGP